MTRKLKSNCRSSSCIGWIVSVLFDYKMKGYMLTLANRYVISFLISRFASRWTETTVHTKLIYSKRLLRPVVLRVLCCSMCAFWYWPFCHGAHKLDLSTLFSAFFFEHLFSLYCNLFGNITRKYRTMISLCKVYLPTVK